MANELTTQAKLSPIVAAAMDKDLDTDKLDKLLNIQLKHEQNEAKKHFYKDLSLFKSKAPQIDKNATVSYGAGKGGATRYNHATLGYVMAKVTPLLSEHGLNLTWRVKDEGQQISVKAILAHQLGHQEETTLTAPVDNSGSKNPIQAKKSTVTYLERITGMAILGLAEHDADTDAITDNSIDSMPITESQAENLIAAAEVLGRTEDKLVSFINAKRKLSMNKIADLPDQYYEETISMLKKMAK